MNFKMFFDVIVSLIRGAIIASKLLITSPKGQRYIVVLEIFMIVAPSFIYYFITINYLL